MLLVAAYGSAAARRADATSLLGFVAVEPNGGSVPAHAASARPGGLLGLAERHTGLVVAPSVAPAAVGLLSGFALLSRKR